MIRGVMRSGLSTLDVANRLRRIRETFTSNASEFARGAGLAQNAYSQFETGARLLTITAAVKLCNRYGLSLDYLYRDDPASMPLSIMAKLQPGASVARRKKGGAHSSISAKKTAKSRLATKVIAAALTLPMIGGCGPTMAQRQLQTTAAENRAAVAGAQACLLEVYNSPQAASIRPHIAFNPAEATLAQMSDQSLATPDEIAAILAVYPRYKACQRQAIADLSRSMPTAVPILERTYAAGDDDTALLIQRRISWGDRLRRGRDRALAAAEQIRGAARRTFAALQAEHEAELERRAEAGKKLSCMAGVFGRGSVYTAPMISGELPPSTGQLLAQAVSECR